MSSLGIRGRWMLRSSPDWNTCANRLVSESGTVMRGLNSANEAPWPKRGTSFQAFRSSM